jgi:DNA-binding transcriptional ArsR family regulator
VTAFEALADPTRRRIVELLAQRERTAGELATAFTITRPGVSKHLRVLREEGLVSVRGDAQRRIYRLEPKSLAEAEEWLGRTRAFWEQRLDALGTELHRGRKT